MENNLNAVDIKDIIIFISSENMSKLKKIFIEIDMKISLENKF